MKLITGKEIFNHAAQSTISNLVIDIQNNDGVKTEITATGVEMQFFAFGQWVTPLATVRCDRDGFGAWSVLATSGAGPLGAESLLAYEIVATHRINAATAKMQARQAIDAYEADAAGAGQKVSVSA